MEFPFSRVFGAGTHQLGSTDLNVLADTTLGAVNFVLPSIDSIINTIATQGYSVGNVGLFPMNITDVGNNASVNNITITCNPADEFNGEVSAFIINQNKGTAQIKPTSSNIWNIIQSGSSGGGVSGVAYADTEALLPPVGNPAILYITKDFGKQFRWDGSLPYIEILGQLDGLFVDTFSIFDKLISNTNVNVESGKTSLTAVFFNNQSRLLSLVMPELTIVGDYIQIDQCSNLSIIDLPALITLNSASLFTNLLISQNSLLTTINMPLLATFGGSGGRQISNNPLLTSVNLNSLVSYSGGLTISNNATLPSFSLPALTTGSSIIFLNNAALVTINVPLRTGGGTTVNNNASLTTLNIQAQTTGFITIAGNPLLSTINNAVFTTGAFSLSGSSVVSPSLPAHVSGGLIFDTNNLMTSFSAPVYASILGNGEYFQCTNNPLLTAISLPSFLGDNVDIQNNNLLSSISMPLFDGEAFSVYNCDALPSISLPAFSGNLVSAAFVLDDNAILNSITLPSLTDINYFQVSNNAVLTTLSVNTLINGNSNIVINVNPSLTTISLSGLVNSPIAIDTNNSLTSVDISSWIGDAVNFSSYIFNNASLTDIIATSYNTSNSILFFNDNALTSDSISQMLIDFDTNGATNCQLFLNGGTNAGFASLTVAGATAHANLLAKTWTITMNP